MAFALSALFAGCTGNPVEDPANEKITVHASVESTRTSLGNDLSVRGSEGDDFHLFSNTDTSGEIFTITSGAGSVNASFEGYKPVGTSFVAVYPSSGVLASEGRNVQMVFPGTQDYVKGSFARSANPMIATASGDVSEVFFRNVCGLLESKVTARLPCALIPVERLTYGRSGVGGFARLVSADLIELRAEVVDRRHKRGTFP